MQATDPLHAPGLPSSPADDPSDGLAGWLRLLAADGVGPVAGRALLDRFTSPAAIFGASFSALCDVVRPDQARALLAAPSDAAQVDATLAWLARPGNTLLRLSDPAYPRYLKELPDAPLLLYVKGDRALLARPALAVVGSRNASAQGLQNAVRFSRALSEAGITIVSGLALGIDAAAHAGGLASVGSSIAVIGTGADVVYPRRNHALAHRLANEGCIVSEYALGTPPMAANFPRRNRLISGLARGVLVVEAAAKSGSLITARMAAEQGREVFAIPGSIHAVLAKGCHALIREGAKLVETAQDIFEELRLEELRLEEPRWPAAAPVPAAPHGAGDVTLLAAMAFEPADIDTLLARTGLSAAEVSARLLALELAEMVQRLPGGQFQRLVV